MCEIVQQEIPLISGVPLEKQLARVRVRHDALVANRPAVAEHLRKMDAEIAELAKVLEERRDLSRPSVALSPPELRGPQHRIGDQHDPAHRP